MAANSRLTIAVHALAWMALAQQRGQPVLTSERVAASVNTNPVVLRRSLGDLRQAGLVEVRQGAAAGWSLAKDPEQITLSSARWVAASGSRSARSTKARSTRCAPSCGGRRSPTC